MSEPKDRAGGLRLVPDGKPATPLAEPKRKPPKPLSAKQREGLEEDIARGEALVDALDMIAVAYGTAGARLAIDQAVRGARQLGDDVEHLQRVIATLAVDAVWMVPPAVVTPRTAGEISMRQVQLRLWCTERRREVVSGLRAGRRLLRREP